MLRARLHFLFARTRTYYLRVQRRKCGCALSVPQSVSQREREIERKREERERERVKEGEKKRCRIWLLYFNWMYKCNLKHQLTINCSDRSTTNEMRVFPVDRFKFLTFLKIIFRRSFRFRLETRLGRKPRPRQRLRQVFRPEINFVKLSFLVINGGAK
jgi:hypothetical protein